MESTFYTNALHLYQDDIGYLEINQKKRYKEFRGYFTMIGELNDKNTRVNKIDLLDRLASISKSSIILFNQMKANRDPYTNIVVMDEFEDYEKSKMSTTYKRLVELQNAHLIVRLQSVNELMPLMEYPGFNIQATPKKFSYMINPDYIQPKHHKERKTYEPAIALWNVLNHLKDNKD